ncbi:MAG: hypothetical protein GIW99_07090 [Candidatus Eremiobacteraeota bacterium]|nr:hypothetical protein [Candidatus Eremiobacteraeota bacterium]MBC5827429.1 hypothetical protein [Candidatus Eremiobacteraeota bacterium]
MALLDSIKHNFGLKLTAALVAVLLWFTFNFLSVAQGSYNKTLELPLGVHQVGSGLVAAAKLKTVSVELSGPRSRLDALTPASLDSFIDCGGKGAGTYLLPITVVGPDADKIKVIRPPHSLVVIDRYAYRAVPVVARQSNGGPLQAAVDPKSVTIAGAQTAVAQVLAAEVTVPARDAFKKMTAEVKPVPVDGLLAAVGGVTVDPPVVRILIAPATPRKEAAHG